jgi:tRNA pseudouridine38-40 synthase
VQGVLEDALDALFPGRGPLAVAGRTDTGVHASGQVASLQVEQGPPAERVPAALNQQLPADVAVTACEVAAGGFHARFSARARTYEYRVRLARVRSPLRAGRVHHYPQRVDWERLERCAAAVLGEHDFRAFTPTETQHAVFRRVVLDAAWRREGDEAVFRIEADSFLRHMVRTLVGTMLDVGSGRVEPEGFAALLAGAERHAAGTTAPPHALCLVAVRY